MSMIGNLRRVTDEEVARSLAGPEEIGRFLYGEPGAHEDTADIDLDKAWHGIHFVVTGSDWGGETPLNFLVSGGTPVGDEDVGYGEARAFTSAEVRRIHEALAVLPPEEFQRRIDLRALAAAGIYPDVWDREDEADDNVEYVASYVEALNGIQFAGTVPYGADGEHAMPVIQSIGLGGRHAPGRRAAGGRGPRRRGSGAHASGGGVPLPAARPHPPPREGPVAGGPGADDRAVPGGRPAGDGADPRFRLPRLPAAAVVAADLLPGPDRVIRDPDGPGLERQGPRLGPRRLRHPLPRQDRLPAAVPRPDGGESSHHREYWIPAAELPAFNEHVDGPIVVTHEYRGG